jgi:hypothetical protein
MVTGRRSLVRAACLAVPLLSALAWAGAARAELRINNLSVFLNDLDVTVRVVLLGTLPEPMLQSLHSGIPVHVRLTVELWQQNRLAVDRRIRARTIERQVAYSVLSKEYKVTSLAGEQREPYVTKDLREAQRVVSEIRAGNLAPAASLSPRELYYVRVRSDMSPGGVNSWFARFTGDAEETPWTQSSLLTVTRSQ